MTFGSGGGSPKTIQRVIYTFGSTLIYTGALDQLAIINPLLMVSGAGAGVGFSSGFFQIRNVNPATAANMDESFNHLLPDTGPYFGSFGPVMKTHVSIGGGSFADKNYINPARFESLISLPYPDPTAGSSTVAETFGQGLIIYPGEQLLYVGAAGGNKMVYQLREYGIAS